MRVIVSRDTIACMKQESDSIEKPTGTYVKIYRITAGNNQRCVRFIGFKSIVYTDFIA